MDILIKNMEMPKYCRSCPFEVSSIYGQKCCITRKFTRLNDNEDGMKRHISCPLVALPEHKKAYWRNAMCSNCGAVRLVSASGNFYFVNYCHNCGAEIVEANNE